jgi:hypothetical protein
MQTPPSEILRTVHGIARFPRKSFPDLSNLVRGYLRRLSMAARPIVQF